MDKENNFVHPLQSIEWASFRKKWGNEILATKHGYITLHKIPFLPYKIGVFEKGPEPTKDMLEDLGNLGPKNNLIFIKLEPNTPKVNLGENKYKKIIEILTKNGCIKGKTLFTPTSFWINLKPTESEIYKSFTSKTRYNIRLAEKHGVIVKEDNSDSAFKRYLDLTRETVERQGFYAHSKKYHQLMWNHLHKIPTMSGKKPIAHLLTASYNGEIITTWILFSYGKFLYYPYGASSEKYKNVMANNLMMWEAIKFGKKLGLSTFDLWGREEGKGFTKFKEGYNPQVVEFLGSWDMVLNPILYKVYRLAENFRWKFLRIRAKITPTKPTF